MNYDVTDIDHIELLLALYEGSRVSPNSWICQARSRENVTLEDIRKEATISDFSGLIHFPDYLFGRPIKAFLRREGVRVMLCRTDLYDRDAGYGVAETILKRLGVIDG
jgi:hypothetical protein